MKDPAQPRMAFDVGLYARRARQGPCFICALLGGEPGCDHHQVYEDEHTIAFLNRNPTLRDIAWSRPNDT